MNKRSGRRASTCFCVPLGLVLCAPSASATSAKSAPSTDWHSVQALPSQTRIWIVTNGSSQGCYLDSVSEDRIACSSRPSQSGPHHEFTREQVRTVRINGHFDPTTAIAITAGFTGAGAAIGATQNKGFSNSAKPIGVGAAGGFGVGVVIGLIVGHAYGGSHGSIVYRRP